MTIKFYDKDKPYFCFTNFSQHGFELGGQFWPTSEHYFQAQKFKDKEIQEKIRLAAGPKEAAELGRNREFPLRADWEEIKYDIMKSAVRAKFNTHSDIKDILLSTGNQNLIEDSPIDYVWGCGKDGTGKNLLGKILIEVREELARVNSD